MRGSSSEQFIESFYGEIKTGLRKKDKITLYINTFTIDGIGATLLGNKNNTYPYKVKIENIKRITDEVIDGNNCLIIEYLNDKVIVGNPICTLILPNLKKASEAKMLLSSMTEEILKAKYEKEENEKQQQQTQMEIIIKHQEECQKYFDDCFDFHIKDQSNPYYELVNDSLLFACIYIDKSSNINILKIDGNNKEESNATIPYEKIHYYDTAGNIHYTTDVNGGYSSLGGSITGDTFSKGATILGTLLFGMMGMVGGALLTHKAAKTELPSTNFNISSNVQKVDDRSVILNYYSDIKKQYIDVEFSDDIYNFFQTHLPHKKYSIVLEIEKQQALDKEKTNFKDRELEITTQNQFAITQEDHLDEFALKVKKLKTMYDMGILTEEEFDIEKKRILSQLS